MGVDRRSQWRSLLPETGIACLLKKLLNPRRSLGADVLSRGWDRGVEKGAVYQTAQSTNRDGLAGLACCTGRQGSEEDDGKHQPNTD